MSNKVSTVIILVDNGEGTGFKIVAQGNVMADDVDSVLQSLDDATL